MSYGRLQKVGTWIWSDFCWFCFFLLSWDQRTVILQLSPYVHAERTSPQRGHKHYTCNGCSFWDHFETNLGPVWTVLGPFLGPFWELIASYRMGTGIHRVQPGDPRSYWPLFEALGHDLTYFSDPGTVDDSIAHYCHLLRNSFLSLL